MWQGRIHTKSANTVYKWREILQASIHNSKLVYMQLIMCKTVVLVALFYAAILIGVIYGKEIQGGEFGPTYIANKVQLVVMSCSAFDILCMYIVLQQQLEGMLPIASEKSL